MADTSQNIGGEGGGRKFQHVCLRCPFKICESFKYNGWYINAISATVYPLLASTFRTSSPRQTLRTQVQVQLTCNFDKNSLVPDFAIVPRFFTRSSFVIPIPVSVTCKTLLSLSALILIDISSVASNADLSVRERKRILSKASEAFEINSLRKI